MHALILGAGAGTRLWPLTATLAKPAVPVLGRPLVSHTCDSLLRLGVPSISMTLFHQARSVLDLNLERRYPALNFIVENRLLGTGGGIRNALRQIDDDLLIICNGDTLWDFDLRAALDEHIQAGRDLTLVLTAVPEWRDYSALRRDAYGRVVRIGRLVEVPFVGSMSPPYVYAGISIVSRALLEHLPDREVFDYMTDFVVPLMRSGQPVHGAVANGFWSDMGTPQRYLQGCLRFAGRLHGKPFRYILGSRCYVHPGAQLRDVVLWDDVAIEAPVRLERCIVASGVTLEDEISAGGAILLPASSAVDRFAGDSYRRVEQALLFSCDGAAH